MKRITPITLVMCMLAVSAFGQDRSVWRTAAEIRENSAGSVVGTVLDVEEGAGHLRLQLDADPYQQVTVVTDSVSTQYYGFGGIINGSPEIFRGTSGFVNIREGDRVDVYGQGRAGGRLAAGQITLLGRSVAAGTVGVGTTRDGTSVSTPTTSTTTAEAIAARYVEGTVRQVNANEGRIVIQAGRRMITVNTVRSTPVYYQGELYRVANLEPGDVVRIDPEPRSAAADEITARSIEVTRSVQDAEDDGPVDQRLTTLVGRVVRVDRASDMVTVDTGRGQVRVDMIRAADRDNRRMRAGDLRVGEEVEIVGSYGGSSDLFLASTVRFGTPSGTEVVVEDEDVEDRDPEDYVIVTFSGTVTESLQTSPTLIVRDTGGRTLRVYATNDFAIQTRTGSYVLASTLKAGDSVLIKAWRDEDENLIAQTIRLR